MVSVSLLREIKKYVLVALSFCMQLQNVVSEPRLELNQHLIKHHCKDLFELSITHKPSHNVPIYRLLAIGNQCIIAPRKAPKKNLQQKISINCIEYIVNERATYPMQCATSHLEPMKGDSVLYAPSGEGCEVVMSVLRRPSIPLHLEQRTYIYK